MMEEEYTEMEDTIINRLSVLDSIKLLAPEIQEWIMKEFGDYESFVESLEDQERICDLFELISERKLNWREQKVIFLRYGIIDGTPKSLEDVSKEMGMTRERVRLIEAKCLHRGCIHRSRKLKDFLDA